MVLAEVPLLRASRPVQQRVER